MPDCNITYVVYNDNMISTFSKLIIELKGAEFFKHNVTVVSIGNTPRRRKGKIYLDSSLYELMGNGSN